MPRQALSDKAAHTLGKNVERLRLRLDLGTGEAARKFGISTPTLVQIEAGNRVPSLAMLVKLQRGLKVDWNLLLEAVSDA